MNEDLQTIVVRVIPKHPTGKRNRAGFSFTEKPVSVKVNAEQLDLIKNDQYLKIIEKGIAYQQGLDNQIENINDNGGENIGNDGDIKDDENNTGETDQDLTKAQIIEKLLEKGLIQGEDFNKAAKKDDLILLLNS